MGLRKCLSRSKVRLVGEQTQVKVHIEGNCEIRQGPAGGLVTHQRRGSSNIQHE